MNNLSNWVAHMWKVMAHTGNGYHRPSMKHTGEGTDRRNDKLRETYGVEFDDGGKERPVTIMVERNETKLQRKFRTAIPIFMKTRRAR